MGFWHFLGEPAWQGVGALITLVALVLALWVERRRHTRKVNGPARQNALANDFPAAVSDLPHGKVIRHFSISDEEGERLFYEEFMSRIRDTKEIIYRMGRLIGARIRFFQEFSVESAGEHEATRP